MRRNLLTKLTLAASAAALAFGAVACEVEDNGTDPGVEDPALDDTGDDL